MRVVHIITGLNTGGAEMMLYRVLGRLQAAGVENHVVSLRGEGPVAGKIKSIGIPVEHIPPRRFSQLVRKIRSVAPEVVQTWMYHADLIGGLAARAAGVANVVWGIQNGTIDPKQTKPMTRAVVKMCSVVARRVAARIAVCGKSVADIHEAAGFPRDRMVVIYNGFDTTVFTPVASNWRMGLGIGPEEFVIAQFARYDPQKDYANYLAAAGIINKRFPDKCRFVVCGSNADSSNRELLGLAERAGVRDRLLPLGLQDDVRPIMAGADIATLSSRYGEGLPLSIGESMAMALPCVVTDVGDSGHLVGDTGITVPPAQSELLAEGWITMLQMSAQEREQRGRAARQRVIDHFSLANTAGEYLRVYKELCARATAP